MPFKHLQKQGCPKCKESNGEKAIRVFLETNNIDYKYQEIIGDLNLPFDFYIPNYNLAIEFDGEQHRSCNNFYSIKEAKRQNITPEEVLLRQKERDKIKTNFCKQYNITLLRINKLEEVNNVLTKFFSNSNSIEIKKEKTLFSKIASSTKVLTKVICIETGEIDLLKNKKIPAKALNGFSLFKGKHWRRLNTEEINNSELVELNNKKFLKAFKKKLHRYVICEETGKRYYSMKEAVKDLTGEYNRNKETNICKAIKHHTVSLGYHWSYLSSFE